MRPDEDLLADLAQGDHAALRVLYERHAAAVLRLIRRLTSDQGMAEEILQETWLAVWRSAAAFRGESSAKGWVMGVARRQAHNQLRRTRLQVIDLAEAGDVPDPAPGVEEQVLQHAERTELMTAVAALPEHLSEVLELVLVEELPYPEVATVLAIPVGTVKSRMSHARQRLGRMLAAGRLEEAKRP
ncbi:RNA polymerase sigma factor [Streptomyces candidus]|uniref:RNA polymerase sigma-70 factor (ECF subfamily) n=1 Tax=Streptomyces candidus TaxID=67283 RepID=A0A7X0HCI5_9ACTN|nr:sigma-70 family RNA polymerase sigma factor [Streptomyces candidus]MBB6435123.1 RNA polymerase sigma-70 factor (ECF subfamily) [Streptomyces candidus]GHH40771.1 RNA polymerase sigma factor [Streptomyces candidus]